MKYLNSGNQGKKQLFGSCSHSISLSLWCKTCDTLLVHCNCKSSMLFLQIAFEQICHLNKVISRMGRYGYRYWYHWWRQSTSCFITRSRSKSGEYHSCRLWFKVNHGPVDRTQDSCWGSVCFWGPWSQVVLLVDLLFGDLVAVHHPGMEDVWTRDHDCACWAGQVE